MKKFLLAISLFCTAAAFAQDTQVTMSGNTKIIRGFMSKAQLTGDSLFPWVAANRQGYVPPAETLKAMMANRDSVHYLVFGGTWCGDTKALLPKFFALTEAAGVPDNRITLIGVDQGKTTVHGLEKAFNITRVPTFIVLRNGREIGRVVEYGRTGMYDRELGSFITASSTAAAATPAAASPELGPLQPAAPLPPNPNKPAKKKRKD